MQGLLQNFETGVKSPRGHFKVIPALLSTGSWKQGVSYIVESRQQVRVGGWHQGAGWLCRCRGGCFRGGLLQVWTRWGLNGSLFKCLETRLAHRTRLCGGCENTLQQPCWEPVISGTDRKCTASQLISCTHSFEVGGVLSPFYRRGISAPLCPPLKGAPERLLYRATHF